MTPVLGADGTPTRAPYRVMIAVPARDVVATGFAYDLARLVGATARQRPDIDLWLTVDKGTLITAQRHRLVEQALAAEATHVLWLDSDMRFPKDTLVRLLAHNVPIVAASYVERRVPVRPVAFLNDTGVEADDRLYIGPEAAGCTTVAAVGMGVMLTQIGVFQRTPPPWFQIGYHTDAATYVSEDVYFCRKMRDAGFEIVIDQDLSRDVRHLGEFEYRHEHALMARDGASYGH